MTITFTEIIKTMSELELFLTIEGITVSLAQTSNLVNSGKLQISDQLEKETDELKEMLLNSIKEIERFGVSNPVIETTIENNIYLTPSKEYETWFTKWTNWKSGLTQEQWEDVSLALETENQDIPHLP